MAGKWWEAAPVVGGEQQPQGGVILSDPYQERGDQRDEVRTDLAVDSNQRDARREVRDVNDKQFDQTVKLADQYNRDPTIAGYRESLGNFATALKTGDNPQGDNALITAYVKVFDPGSVVNEGEREGVASSQGALNNLIEKAKRDFGMTDSGMFTPEARKRIRSEMINIMGKRVKGYNQRREYYGRQAQSFNLDPTVIIGGHDADPLVPLFQEYDQANGLGEFAQGQEAQSSVLAPAGGRAANEQDNAALGPGDKFLYDETGNPIAIQSADGSVSGYSQVIDEVSQREAEAAAKARYGDDYGTRASSLIKGASFNLSDEAAGVMGGVYDTVTGGSFAEGYGRERDIERAVQDKSRQDYGIGYELLGGLMVPGAALKIGGTKNLATTGAASGGLAGFGEGEGLPESLGTAAVGTALGGVTGAVAKPVLDRLSQSGAAQRLSGAFGNGRAQQAQDFTEAAKRQKLDYMMADVPGNYGSKMATGVTAMTLGGIPLKAAATKIIDKAKAAKDRIAGNVGNRGDSTATGQAAQRGLETWEKQTEGKGGQLFDAIPIPGDSNVNLTTTKQTLAEINGQLSSNSDLAALVRDPKLVAFQQALEKGGLSWDDTKAFRTRIGKIIGKPGLTSDGASDDAMRALYSSLTQDIEQTAAAHSPEAAKAFSRANSYWRGRQGRIDDVMSKLVGKDRNMSAEQTTAQLERWARAEGGDFNKIARAVRSLPEDEAGDVRSYFINRMGMARKGSQDETGEVFSPDTWMTNWNSVSPRAKAVLFQGEHRKALDDLATVFSGMKASRAFANPSGTGYSVWGATNATLAGVNPVMFALSAVGQVGAGALLASPRFAKWMVALSKKPNPSAGLAHVNQLTGIAKAEPAIANDIFSLQERLAQAFSEPLPGRLAAEENNPERQGPPQDGERGNAQ